MDGTCRENLRVNAVMTDDGFVGKSWEPAAIVWLWARGTLVSHTYPRLVETPELCVSLCHWAHLKKCAAECIDALGREGYTYMYIYI